MSFIIVIVKIVRTVIRNVVTEIHDCYLLLVDGAGNYSIFQVLPSHISEIQLLLTLNFSARR